MEHEARRTVVSERLLFTLPEAARALSVATRTLRRLIERGELPAVRIGRSVRVPVAAVCELVEARMTYGHNQLRAGPGMCRKEVNACHTDAKIVPFGGCRTPTQAERELDALLGPQTARKPRR
ncbi:MAG: helix-turn-helix domain-containing protein [Chloroflexi bacterium]|nr:helix-turn-helix domain-containing protein [Chloroflexota bacterium]